MKKFNYKDIFINKHVAISRAISMVENNDSQVAEFYDKIYKYYHIDFRGSSFLLHPDVLLYNAYQYSYKDICIYVAMASARSYAEYAAHGKLSLDRIHLTIDPFMFLDNPSLLRMDDEGVHFRYEEAPTEIH